MNELNKNVRTYSPSTALVMLLRELHRQNGDEDSLSVWTPMASQEHPNLWLRSREAWEKMTRELS